MALRAEFRGADLRGAHLLRADLVGADFEAAQFDFNDRLEPVLVDMQSVNLSDPESFGDGSYGIYAAPEELVDAGTLSPTADVYGAGRILEFLLLGEDPAPPDRDVRSLESLQSHPTGIVRMCGRLARATLRVALRSGEPRYVLRFRTEVSFPRLAWGC